MTYKHRKRNQAIAMSSLIALSAVIPFSVFAGTSNSLMDISTDGKLLACSNRDSGTVTIVDLATHTKLHEVAVGTKPEGVSFIGDSHRLAIAVYGEDCIVCLNGDSGEVFGRCDVFDEPYGIVSDPSGEHLYVTLDYPGQLLTIDVASLRVTATFQGSNFLRGIALSAADGRAYLTEYYTSKVIAVDLAKGTVVDEWTGTSTDNLTRQLVLSPRRGKIYVPHMRSRVTAVHGEGSIFPYVSVIDTPTDKELRRKRIPLDSFGGNRVTANPWEVTVSPDGRSLFIVFAGTDDMFVCEILDDDYREITPRKLLQIGSNPRAVRVAPNGKTAYVYNALDFNVVAYDVAKLEVRASIPVTANPLGDTVLQGKKLFYSAQQPMVGRRWISCSSCHPDGEPDGRTWHNPEGLRNTQSLAGMAWTHPIHWSADRDEVQDFEHTIRGPLMQGRGLIQGQVQESLRATNVGLSKSLDALAAYSNSHKFSLSPYAKKGLSEAAQRGRDVFFDKATQCATCHSGPFYCDSQPRAANEIVRHNVGTGDVDPSEKLGPAYDTPTLLGIYRTAPYLHDGTAATLEEVLTTANQNDRHGKTSHLTSNEIADLVQFLKSLPYEDPEPLAKAAGITKVER
jgi:YVTN family beta-propeller protein